MNITCIWAGHNILGEGPLWDPRRQQLFWVDIEQAELHALTPSTQQHQQWQLPDKPGCLALTENHGLLIALRQRFIFLNPETGEHTDWISPLAGQDRIAFNDGRCDAKGRLWIGSKQIAEKQPYGNLYCLEADGKFSVMDEGFTVSNGLTWSLDNKLMYFTDSPAGTIYVYDFDLTHGKISNRRVFVQVDPSLGYPDGLTIDKQGYLWSAHWNGWQITRYHPSGKIDRVIKMPIPHVTSCCFGSTQLDTLFITTAARGLSEQQLAKTPQAGNLFAIQNQLPSVGINENYFTKT